MTANNEQMDLCTNCLNISHCFYHKAKKEPVLFCEEFTCKDTDASIKEIERFKKAEEMSMSRVNQGLFDDCGRL